MTKTVAARVQEVRRERKWTQQQLADALDAIGWPTDRSTIVRLEAGRRGVSVDDLVALAVALNVSPGWLLLPPSAGDDPVTVIGSKSTYGWAAWAWVEGRGPLPTVSMEDDLNTDEEVSDFFRCRPAEVIERERHPATRAAQDVLHRIRRVLYHAAKPDRGPDDAGFTGTMRRARSALGRVAAELDDLDAPGTPDDVRKER